MLRRPLLGMAAAFLLGIWMAAGEKIGLAALTFVLWAILAGVLLWRSEARVLLGVRLLLLLAGGVAGYLRCQSESDFRAAYLPVLSDGGEITLQGTLSQKEYKNNQFIYHLSAPYIRAVQTGQEFCGETNEVLVYLESGQSDPEKIGEILVIQGTISLWRHATNEGSFDEADFYLSRKQDFKVENAVIVEVHGKTDFLGEKLFWLRRRLAQVYETSLAAGGIMMTMLLGDKSMLEPKVKTLYQNAGILHITCISGLHFAVIGMTLNRFLRKRRLGTLPAAVIAGGVILCYAKMTGGSASSSRAVVMFLLSLLAPVAGRTYDSLNALGAAALVLLWSNPFLYQYAGFLFSCAAVVGVVWIGKSRGRRERMQILYRGLAVELATLPFAAWYYYEIPRYGVLINLIVLPFVKPLLLCGLCGGFMGLFSLPAAKILLFPCHLILSGYWKLCQIASLLPDAMQITGRPSAARMTVYFAALLLWNYLRLCRERARLLREEAEKMEEAKKEPLSRVEAKETTKSAYATFAWSQSDDLRLPCEKSFALPHTVRNIIGGLLLLLLLFCPPRKGFELTMLDVGQGDSSFIRTEAGYTLFVDGGSSNISKVGQYRILPFLKYNGAREIDYWFVSHTDKDHISGLEELLTLHYPIGTLVFSEITREEETCVRLQQLAEKNGTRLLFLEDKDQLQIDQAVLTIYLPEDDSGDKNEDSLVILYEERGFLALLTGDIGEIRERELAAEKSLQNIDFYKAAHHASNGSNTEAFLQRLRPKAAGISCAEKNSYGHPGGEAVERIAAAGGSLFYTMEAGQLRVVRQKDIFLVEPYREPFRCYVFPLSGDGG